MRLSANAPTTGRLIKIYLTEDYIGSGYGGGPLSRWPDDKRALDLMLEEAQAAVDEAHRRGLKVASHAYGGEGLRIVLESGVDLPMHPMVSVNGKGPLDEETIKMFLKPLPNGERRMSLQDLNDAAVGAGGFQDDRGQRHAPEGL